MKQGVFYGVSVGPGDPELLTLKAIHVLENCPVIAAPQTKGGDMLALNIARQAVSLEGKTVLPLFFTMAQDTALRQESHQKAVEDIEGFLTAGKDVAMLSLGDVSIYATYCYLQEQLAARGFETVMIPGVPSFCAVAARLGMSLTQGDEPLYIIPGYSDQTNGLLARPGTKVLMKAGKRLPDVVRSLREMDMEKRAVLVQNCGLPNEAVFRDIERFSEEPGYFTTVIVKG